MTVELEPRDLAALERLALLAPRDRDPSRMAAASQFLAAFLPRHRMSRRWATRCGPNGRMTRVMPSPENSADTGEIPRRRNAPAGAALLRDLRAVFRERGAERLPTAPDGSGAIVDSYPIVYKGDMPTEPTLTVKKLVAMTPDLAERISAFRFEQRIKTEAEAIRTLIERGLQAAKAQKPAPRRTA